MNILNCLFAALIGFVCWGMTAAFSGGVAPMGKTGGTEGLFFFMPVVIFSLPVAVYALVREHFGTAMWLGALAPLLGLLNYVLAVGINASVAVAEQPSNTTALAFTAGWVVLLAIGVVVVRAARKADN